jgi:hypothetical protein
MQLTAQLAALVRTMAFTPAHATNTSLQLKLPAMNLRERVMPGILPAGDSEFRPATINQERGARRWR